MGPAGREFDLLGIDMSQFPTLWHDDSQVHFLPGSLRPSCGVSPSVCGGRWLGDTPSL